MRSKFLFILFHFWLIAFSQKEYYVSNTDSVQIFVQETGTGDTIILLAGGPGMNKMYMLPLIESLKPNYHCIIFDQRGTGNTKIASDFSLLNVEYSISDIECIRKYLRLNKLTIIGHSWGGMLAMEYTSRFPENMRNLILLNSGGPSYNFAQYYVNNIYKGLLNCNYTQGKKIDSINFYSFKEILPGYFYNCDKAVEFIRSPEFDQYFGFDSKINDYVFNSYFKLQDERLKKLIQYKGPVSIIQGDVDPISDKTANEIKYYLPQSKIHYILKCGHFPWFEGEQQKNDLIMLIKKACSN